MPFFAIGAAGASLTGKDCTPYTIHYAYDTTALANGTAKTIVKQGGKSWFFLTADYAFGTQLQNAATNVVKANGGTVVGAVRVPLGNLRLLLLPAAGAEFGRAGARPRQRRHRLLQFAEGRQRIRHRQDDEAGGAARLPHRHPRASASTTAQGLYLTTGWYWDLNDKTRAFAKRFFDKTNREPTFMNRPSTRRR